MEGTVSFDASPKFSLSRVPLVRVDSKRAIYKIDYSEYLTKNVV